MLDAWKPLGNQLKSWYCQQNGRWLLSANDRGDFVGQRHSEISNAGCRMSKEKNPSTAKTARFRVSFFVWGICVLSTRLRSGHDLSALVGVLVFSFLTS